MMTQLRSLADQQFLTLWQALPADRAVSEEEATGILERGARQEGNGAWSSATLLSLGILGVVVREGDLYRRAEVFPELPEDHSNRHGTDVFNAALERQQAEERRRNEIRDREAQRAYENGPAGRERRERLAEMRETARDVYAEEKDNDDRVLVLEAKVRRLEGVAELEGTRAAA